MRAQTGDQKIWRSDLFTGDQEFKRSRNLVYLLISWSPDLLLTHDLLISCG